MPPTDVIPEDARDLIKSLLVMNPEERLGAGPEGSSNSFGALRNHPFFKDFDFK
jgi:3-phosphoinositide dependent protein kinase-1